MGILNPIDGVSMEAKKEDGKTKNLASNFYLTAVPSQFKDTWNNVYQVYQLTANFEHDVNAQ